MSDMRDNQPPDTLRALVLARYGTLAKWGDALGVSAYKARLWANGRDAMITPDEHARISDSLGLSEVDYYTRYANARLLPPGSHVHTLTSRQLAHLLTIATEVGAASAVNTHFDRAATTLIAERAREMASNGETWLTQPEMRDFLKWWAFSLDFNGMKDDAAEEREAAQ